MTIPDEAVEAAAKSLYRNQMEDGDTEWEVFVNVESSYVGYWRGQARAALEAAAPFIRAEALEDAADALDELWKWRRARFDRDWADGVEESETLLRARAAEMRQG